MLGKGKLNDRMKRREERRNRRGTRGSEEHMEYLGTMGWSFGIMASFFYWIVALWPWSRKENGRLSFVNLLGVALVIGVVAPQVYFHVTDNPDWWAFKAKYSIDAIFVGLVSAGIIGAVLWTIVSEIRGRR